MPGNFGMFFVEFRKERAQTRKWRGPEKKGKENIVFLCDFCFAFTLRKSGTYTQIHTPAWYKGMGGGGWMEPLSGVFDMLQYFQTILLLVVSL